MKCSEVRRVHSLSRMQRRYIQLERPMEYINCSCEAIGLSSKRIRTVLRELLFAYAITRIEIQSICLDDWTK